MSRVEPGTTEHDVYAAWQNWENALSREAARYEFTMKEGDLVLFDNRRVLHARTSFRDKTDEEREADRKEGKGQDIVEGEPTRWLKGCYLDGEVVWDSLVSLKRELEGDMQGGDSSRKTGEVENINNVFRELA
jgi:gamma-butyrobetaine dioxygenase